MLQYMDAACSVDMNEYKNAFSNIEMHSLAVSRGVTSAARLLSAGKVSLEHCVAYGDGLKIAYKLQEAHFMVEVRDARQNTMDDGRSHVAVNLRGPNDETTAVVDNRSNGYYGVTYLPTSTGDYHIHVSVDGLEIKDSPFSVTVKTVPRTLPSVCPQKYAVGSAIMSACLVSFIRSRRGQLCG